MMTGRMRIFGPVVLAVLALALATASAAGAAAPGPGALDPSFGGGSGFVSAGAQLLGVAVQRNGEVVVAGQATDQSGGHVFAERFAPGGAPDGTYTGPAGVARAVAVQPNGDIVLAGSAGGAMLVERLTPSLQPDPGFGPSHNGTATALAGLSGVANAVAIGPDGSIVAAGSVYGPDTRAGVARFDAGGNLQMSSIPGFDHFSVVQGVAVQPADGKIVFVGRQTPSQVTDALVGRLNPNGSFDGTFRGHGVFTYHYPGSAQYAHSGYTSLNAVTLQNDGKIVAAGVDAGAPVAAFLRLNADGSSDPSFGSGAAAVLPSGMSTSGEPIGAYGVGIAGGGRIVGAGNYEDTSTDVDAAAWAFTPDGSPETGFGNGGVVRGPTVGYESCALAIAPDGSLVSAGDTVSQFADDTNPCATGNSAGGFVARYIGYGPPPVPGPRPGPPPPPVPGAAPTVTTGLASGTTEVATTVAGAVTSAAAQTSYRFDYGRTSSYGSSTPTAGLPGPVAVVSARLTRLSLRTAYHYRLVASNAAGTSYGADRTFTTAPRLISRLHGVSRSYRIATVTKRGLALKVGCSQGCSITGALTISAASARHLGLGKRALTIAGGPASLGRPGIARLMLHLTAKAKPALSHIQRLTVTLRTVSKPRGGGPAVVNRRTITLTG